MVHIDPVNSNTDYQSPSQELVQEASNISGEGSPKAKQGCRATQRKALAEAVTVLPPDAQEAKEKAAIQNDADLKKRLHGEEITSIEKVEGGYRVYTENYQVMVHVHYLPQSMPGPAHFALSFGQVESRCS